MANLQSILKDYVATANVPEYNGDFSIINSKFPELANFDEQVLKDYVATANAPEYAGNYNIINGKFPELFDTKKTPTSKSKKKEEEITVSEQEEIDARETSIDSDFWKNQKHKREDYYQEDDKWFYKNPEDPKDVRVLTKGPVLEELNNEEARYKNNLLKISSDKKISEIEDKSGEEPNRNDYSIGVVRKAPSGYIDDNGEFVELPPKAGGYYGKYTDPSTNKTYKVIKHPDANPSGFIDVGNVEYEKDLKAWKEARGEYDAKVERIAKQSGVIDEEALEIHAKVKRERSNYNKKRGDLILKINQAKDDSKEKLKLQEELKNLTAEHESKINGIDKEERMKRGEKNMPEVTKELTELDDSESLELFYDRYRKYGFQFSVGIWGGDEIKVTASVDLDGDGELDTETFDVDQGFWGDDDKANSKVAEDMDKWMRKRAVDIGSSVEALHHGATLTKEEEEVKNVEGGDSIDNNIKHKNFEAWIEENREELPIRRSDLNENNLSGELIEAANRYWNGDTKAMLDFMYSGVKMIKAPGSSGIGTEAINPYVSMGTGYLIGAKLEDEKDAHISGGDKYDVSRSGEIDAAIQAVAFDRWRKENPSELENVDIYKANKLEIDQLQEDIRAEWEQLTSEDENGEINWDAIYNSDIYLKSKVVTKQVLIKEEIKNRVTEEIEGMGGSEWFGAFARGESQEKLAEEVGEEVEEYQARIDYINNSSDVLSRELEKIKGDGKTFGLEYEAKWLKENEGKLKGKIQEIQNRFDRGDISEDKANAEVSSLIEEFNTHYDRYENMVLGQSALAETAVSLQLEAKDVLKKEDDLKTIVDVLKRNHQWGTQVVNSLGHATIDLLQGISTAAEAFFYYANPFGRLGDYLVESGAIENEVLKAYIEVGQHVTGVENASERFDDDPTTTSYSEWIHGKIDGWQESNKALVQEPPRFDDIEDFSDFGEWFGVMLGNQAPQLALMFATGGQSAWIQGTLMAATAGGQKFMGMEEQKKLYEESSGLYGSNFSFDQMFWSSAAVGLAESLSERVTFGQIKGVNRMLKANPGAREGFTKYLRDVVFTKDYAKFVGKGVLDLGEEGFSEVLATMSENTIDIMNGEDVGIFDNIAESFVSGVLISQTIKSPVIFNQVYAPFADPDNKSIIDAADRRIREITELISIGRPGKDATKEEIEKWKVQEAKHMEEILKLGQDKLKAISYDVKRVNAMDSPQGNKDKRELLDIHKDQRKIEKEYREVENDENLNEGIRSVRLKELQNQYNTNNTRKGNILGKYTPDITNRKYERDIESAKQRAEELKELDGTQVDIQEGNDRSFLDWLMSNDGYEVLRNDAGEMVGVKLDEKTIKGLKKQNQEILNNEKSSEQDKYQAEQNIKILNDVSRATEGAQDLGFLNMDRFKQLTGQSMHFGAQLTEFDDNGNMKGQKIFINKARSLDKGKFYTATHELLHGILYQTLKRDPDTQQALGDAVLTALNNKGVVIPEKLQKRINQYSKQEGKGEEIMTLLSEAIREGDVKLPGQSLRVLKNFFRGLFQRDTNRDISFDTDEDVINFLGNYSYSMKYNKENKAITRMWSKGAGGKLIEDAKAKYNAKVKKNKLTKGEANFSKNVDQELNNNPDLLTEIDAFVKNEDGSPKYTDKDTWQLSTDFADAYMYITQKKSLDGLIRAGMVAEGVNTPEALRDFTRKVKDELGERLLGTQYDIFIKDGKEKKIKVGGENSLEKVNKLIEDGYKKIDRRREGGFDPGINESLFGWLTGVSGGMGKSIIYRAKGDVMVEYSKEVKTVSIDKGMTTEGGDTFSSQIEGEVDTEMERLETEDLTIGKKTIKKSDIDVIFLESVNTDKRIVEAINGVIDSSGVNLEGLTYNGTKKNIIQHDGGKPKSKRQPVGKLYKVLDLVSKEFGVDPMRIIKEQDLTNSQRIEAREYIENNAEKLIDMLPEGENRSGDATGVANTVLGEFYIEGDRISMAESGTGKGKKSQTKRTDITKKEFIEFFNKPGTKSDGAIRALIVQAATISANQAIRLNAMKKESNPMSIIALAGDGKSRIMFSKSNDVDLMPIRKKDLKAFGRLDATLSEEKQEILENGLDQLSAHIAIEGMVAKGVFEGDSKIIKEILEDVYGDSFSKSELNLLSELVTDTLSAKPITFADTSRKVDGLNEETQSAVLQRLHESNENADTKIKSFFRTDINTVDIHKDKERVKKGRKDVFNYVINRVNQIKKKHPNNDAKAGKEIMKMLKQQEDQHVTAGKIGDGRNQLFAGNPDFISNIVSNIPGLNFKVKVNKKGDVSIDMDSVTYDSKSKKSRSKDSKLEFTSKNKSTKSKKRSESIFTSLDPNIEGTSIEQTRWKDYTQLGKDTILDFIFNPSKILERISDARAARVELNNFVEWCVNEYRAGRMDAIDLQLHASTLLSNMKPTLARAAVPKWIAPSLLPKGYETMTKKQIEAHLEKHGAVYEHMQPRVNMVIHLFNEHLNRGGVKNIDSFFERYNVAVIPTKMDNVLKIAKLNSALASGQSMTMEEWIRYYNEVTKAYVKDQTIDGKLYGMDSLMDIETKEILTSAEAFVMSGELINKNRKNTTNFSKAINQANTIDENTPSRGMSAWDFDDTLATTKSGVRARIPNPDGTPKPGRKVIFLAGGAGSGKSNVVKKLGLEKSGFKIVNSDISLEWLKKNSGLPENMNDLTKEQRSTLGKLQHQARGIAKRKMMKYQGNGDGIVVDGTGGSLNVMKKQVQEFKDAGYDVQMLFVETSLDTALERNKNRKERSLLDIIVRKNHHAVQGNKEAFKELFGDNFAEVSTDNLTMKSPMPQTLVDNIDNFTNSYENRRLDAEEFATEGADILEQGGEFDFTEFDVVTEGAQGPMFKTAMDRAKKFGTEHTYVLTARPPAAAVPIQEFLKSQGLDIPLENITGLGNSTGEAKAEWMLEKFAEGYNDMYFADDAMQNVEAVKHVLDQLDIKSEVIQAKIQFSKSIKPNTETLLKGIDIAQTNSINKVKDIRSLTDEGVYNNIMFSKKHRGEYENLLSKHRPELVKEGLISQTIDNMFNYIDSLNLPDNKKRKYEKIITRWLATSNVKLNEDSYKIKQAVELAEKHKEDIFSYNNPNEIIEKYAGKSKAKPIDPNKVDEFRPASTINSEHGVVGYMIVENTIEDRKAGMHKVREIVDTHWGPNSNPWCLIARSDKQAIQEEYVGPEVVFGKEKAEARKRKLESEGFRVELKNEPVDLLVPGKEGPIANRYKLRKWKPSEGGLGVMDDAFQQWTHYQDGPKRLIFQNGKLLAFYANDQYWDRMDNPTDAPVIAIKEGRVTKKVELVPDGLGGVKEFVLETRTVSEDKKTVTTEILHETPEGFAVGTKIVEDRVNGVTVKKTRYSRDGNVQEIVNFDKKGRATSNFTYYHSGSERFGGVSGINKFGMPFGEMSRVEIVKTKGDIIEHVDVNRFGRHDWHAEVMLGNKRGEVGFELGRNVKIESVLKTSPDGKIRLDLNKVLEADPSTRAMIEGTTPTTLAGVLGKKTDIQFSKKESDVFNLGDIINSNIQKELDLNRVLEQTKGVKAEARYSDAQAKVQGSRKNPWWQWWVPPSAEDFKGLIYRFIGKGRIGEQQMAFFKKTLFDPFARAYEAMNNSKQRLEGEYRALLKEFPSVKSMLNKVVVSNFTLGQMIRVYNWNKAGFEIPGLPQRDLDAIVKAVEGDAETLAFANSLSTISNQEAGYTEPGDYWMVENIQSDINKINNELDRAYHLREWKQNITKMFGEWKNGRLDGPNMNKIEAIYGTKFREALEDMIYAMEFGTSREKGGNRLVNSFNNWANQSVGAIMFLNMRSALLQTISSINYLNWSDNNPLKAGLALANFPQFIKDFTMIFNSDMLKQRRAGNQRGINEAELAEAVAGNRFSPKAIINWLLTKGFLPTQIADSFAIASGGATFYRNRVNTYTKQGMTQEQAESKAWEDFQENTEESQQSSRPDMISQQQRSPLGRYILAFKNTPMQYARLTKKAWLDLINGRGDAKTNVGKIIYYMGVQNLIFSGLQAALGALIGDDDEERDAKAHERVVNSMIDSVLGGLGFGGNAVLTMKNMILEYNKQEKKGWNADHTYTILKFFSFSPTIGSKGRKLYSSIQTEQFNKDVIKEMSMLDIDNPRWSSIANLVSAITNIPLDRLVKKIDNIDAAITEDITAMQRFALLMGWNTWDLDIDDSDVVAVEDEIKEKKKIEKEEEKKIKKEEKKKEEEAENKVKEEENKKKEDGGCIAIGKGGDRCKNEAEVDGYCTVHAKVEQGTKEVQCKKIKSDKTRCKMKTKAKSGYCYYHD